MIAIRALAIAAFALAFAPGAASASEQTLISGGVTVIYEPADRAVAEAIPEVVESARGSLRHEFGLELPDAVTVRLVRSGEPFTAILEGRPVELFAGLAYPETGVVLIDARMLGRAGGSLPFVRTLRHELVHLALGPGQGRLPRWFVEGLATAYGSPLPASESPVAPGLMDLREFPQTVDGLLAAYARSEAAVRHLTSHTPRAKVRELLASLADGEDFDEALFRTTGFTVESLDRAVRRSHDAWSAWGAVAFLFSPAKVLLWAALLTFFGYFFVMRRRAKIAEEMDGDL